MAIVRKMAALIAVYVVDICHGSTPCYSPYPHSILDVVVDYEIQLLIREPADFSHFIRIFVAHFLGRFRT